LWRSIRFVGIMRAEMEFERRWWGNKDEVGRWIGFAEGFEELVIRLIRWLLTARNLRYWSL
jgi:hypothetical protein